MAKRRAEIEEELEMEAENERNARLLGSKEGTGDGKIGNETGDQSEMSQELGESFISTGDVEMKSAEQSMQDDGADEGEIGQNQ